MAMSTRAQVKTASAQAWKRNWHLVRSFFADDSFAIQENPQTHSKDPHNPALEV
jgi:hypothetical protein